MIRIAGDARESRGSGGLHGGHAANQCVALEGAHRVGDADVVAASPLLRGEEDVGAQRFHGRAR